MSHAFRFRLAMLAMLVATPAARTAEQPVADAAAEKDADSTDSMEAHLAGLSAEERAKVEAVLTEYEVEEQAVAAACGTAAYQKVGVIEVPREAGVIRAYHALADGGLVMATGPEEAYGEDGQAGGPGAAGDAKKLPENRLVWLNATGKERLAVSLPRPCTSVTVAPDGEVIAACGDRIVIFAADGRQMAAAEAPHFVVTAEERAAIEEEIMDFHREINEYRQARVADTKSEIEKAEAAATAQRTPHDQEHIDYLKQLVQELIKCAQADESKPRADVIAEGIARARNIIRVAASQDHLFLVAAESGGHNYGIWRCGHDFSEPAKIVGDLSGCCMQMDVQVIGDELVIAENSFHRVKIVGLDGTPRRTFGEACRTDPTKGFSGCCNPMNSCAGPDGTLLLSESSGLVKQFSSDGRFLGIFGGVESNGGCHNVAIGLSADGGRLYYLDGSTGRILMLEKKS